ncbi:MAG: hypothetical protein ACR65O_14130 [Methylomicrobium sp.]
MNIAHTLPAVPEAALLHADREQRVDPAGTDDGVSEAAALRIEWCV